MVTPQIEMNATSPGLPTLHTTAHPGGARGFTIIELMITVTIVGILTAIALPSMQYAVQNNRIKTAASDFHVNMMYARSEAIKRSADVDMVSTGNGWDDAEDTPSGTDIRWGGTVLSSTDINKSIRIQCNTDADVNPESCPSSITFRRDGRLNSSDIPFEIRFFIDESQAPMRCVSISLSGRPRATVDSDDDTSNGC